MTDLLPNQPRFTHELDGLPVAILSEPFNAADPDRVTAWMAGHTYRVNPEYLKPLTKRIETEDEQEQT
jgi:hypothetical protein